MTGKTDNDLDGMMAGIEAERDRILAAVLPHVPFDGWSDVAVSAAGRDLGLSDAELAAVLPQGVTTLVDYHLARIDAVMEARLAAMELPSLRVRDRISTAIRLRLEALAPDKETVRRTLAFLAQPRHGALAFRALYRTVDAIWYAAGDRSADHNFYTKRALLAAVYSSTLCYWLEDNSDGSEESWAFLDRRIADVMKIPQLPNRLAAFGRKMPNPMRFAERLKAQVR